MKEFYIPQVDKTVQWADNDCNSIYGYNGSGKTSLIHVMMDYFRKEGYKFIHYDAFDDF